MISSMVDSTTHSIDISMPKGTAYTFFGSAPATVMHKKPPGQKQLQLPARRHQGRKELGTLQAQHLRFWPGGGGRGFTDQSSSAGAGCQQEAMAGPLQGAAATPASTVVQQLHGSKTNQSS